MLDGTSKVSHVEID